MRNFYTFFTCSFKQLALLLCHNYTNTKTQTKLKKTDNRYGKEHDNREDSQIQSHHP